jgi:hypothetical protein
VRLSNNKHSQKDIIKKRKCPPIPDLRSKTETHCRAITTGPIVVHHETPLIALMNTMLY